MRNYQLHVLTSLLIAGTLGACEDKTKRLPPGEMPTGTVDEIKDKPLAYVDKTVTVIGEVDRVFADTTFEIEGDGFIWDKEILVLTRSPVRFGPMTVRDDDDVVVKGTIKRMAIADLERELGRDLPAEVEQNYRDQPVLVADSVRLIETGFRWSEDLKEGAIVGFYRIISELAPKALAGTSVDLDDIPVQSKTTRGVWIGPSTRSQLFVVPTDAAMLANIAVGDRVDLKGTIREMPAIDEATKQFELDPITTERVRTEAVYIDATELKKSELPPAS